MDISIAKLVSDTDGNLLDTCSVAELIGPWEILMNLFLEK